MVNLLKRLFAGLDVLVPYYTLLYGVMLATVGYFVSRVEEWDAAAAGLMLAAALSYALAYLLPGMVLTGLVSLATVKGGDRLWRRRTVVGTAFVLAFATHLLLLMDAALLYGFGFHFNGLVWNLLITPGGFESMGLRPGTILSVLGGMALILLVHVGFLLIAVYGKRFRRMTAALFGSWRKYAIAAVLIGCFFYSMFAYGYYHYMARAVPLCATDCLPLFQGATMKSFLKKIGCQAPDRASINLQSAARGKRGGLNYPVKPIERRADRPKYNVVWLACESWRADMLTPEIMPETSRFAENALNFTRNFSGGNGTRQGVFTMFYGLYGNYWNAFLKNRRGPLFIDWLLEDGYQFRCITSAKFSYPEFDQTVFARLPASALHSDDREMTWTRDQRNVKLLVEFLDAQKASAQPFMAFMFFESPHAPYEFPPEAAIRKDYADALNYTTLSPDDAQRIKNRYINACRHLDMRLADVLSALKRNGQLDDTIVVIVGDHGEEFYEKGRLGHNSTFVNEQVRTPLVIYIPGVAPRVYDRMSSHLDIVPTLAGFFGVTNPPADYSLGYNLLDPAQRRRYTIMAGWSEVAFADDRYKTLLPQDSVAMVKQKLTDAEDRPLPSLDVFYRDTRNELFRIQQDMYRFIQ